MAVTHPTGSTRPSPAASVVTPDASLTSLGRVTQEETTNRKGMLDRLLSRMHGLVHRVKCRVFKRNTDPPLPVAWHLEGDEKLDQEDFIRFIQLFIKRESPDGTKHDTIGVLPAKFDFGFDEGPDDLFILVNRSIIQDPTFLKHSIIEYLDPENPPIRLQNPDGTNIRLYGEFSAQWAFFGALKKYENQMLFPTALKSIKSRCLLMHEKSPFSCIVGLNTIRENALDKKPDAPVASLGNRAEQPQNNHGKNPILVHSYLVLSGSNS